MSFYIDDYGFVSRNKMRETLHKLLPPVPAPKQEKCSCEFYRVEVGRILVYKFHYGENVVGEFGLEFFPDSIYIAGLELYEEFRGKGLGSNLVAFILEFCRGFSYTYEEVWLMVEFHNEIAQHLYLKFGFKFDNYIGSYCYRMRVKI